MAAWIENGLRVDIALAVTMEIAVLRLQRADNPKDRASAVEFNSRLWIVAGLLADSTPVADDGVELRKAARIVASVGGDIERLAGINAAFARRLAGRAATDGALRQILADWKTHRVAVPQAEFSQWLLDRLDHLVCHEVRRAA